MTQEQVGGAGKRVNKREIQHECIPEISLCHSLCCKRMGVSQVGNNE